MSELLHTPVYTETEMKCDDCGIVLGYLQDIDVDMVETTCPDCNKEYNGSEVKMLCTKCRMESN